MAVKLPGGQASQDLKRNPDETPKWAELEGATLWRERELYQDAVWSWLCHSSAAVPVTVQGSATRDGKEVLPITFDLPDRKATMNVGPLSALTAGQQKFHCLYVEVDDHTKALPATPLLALFPPISWTLPWHKNRNARKRSSCNAVRCPLEGPIVNRRSPSSNRKRRGFFSRVAGASKGVAAPEVLGAMKKGARQSRTAFSIIFYGPQKAIVDITVNQLSPLTLSGGDLQGFQMREIQCFLPKDDPLGGWLPGHKNVNRIATIVSNKGIRPGHTYVVSHIAWSPVILKHLIGFLDITRWHLRMHLICFSTPDRSSIAEIPSL